MFQIASILLIVSTSVAFSVGVSYLGIRGFLAVLGPLGGLSSLPDKRPA